MSHLNVSLIVWAKSQDSIHKPQFFEEKGEPKRIEPRSFCLPAKRLTARPHRLTISSPIPTQCFYICALRTSNPTLFYAFHPHSPGHPKVLVSSHFPPHAISFSLCVSPFLTPKSFNLANPNPKSGIAFQSRKSDAIQKKR